MNILITGGAGYIGSTLISKLVKNNDSIISLDNLSVGSYNHLFPLKKNHRLELDKGDIRVTDSLIKKVGFHGPINAIVHLAATVGVGACRDNPEIATSTNIYGTLNVLEAARKNDIERIVLASTAAVFGNPVYVPIDEAHTLEPLNLYGITKVAAEKLFSAYHKNYGLDTTVLRFSNIYGVGLFTYWKSLIPKFVKMTIEGEPLSIFGDGHQSRDFIHVKDVVSTICQTLSSDSIKISGETFNVGTGKGTSIRKITEIISEISKNKLKRDIDIKCHPRKENESYAREFVFSTEKITRKLNFKPKWSLRNGINELFDHYCKLKSLKTK